MSEYDRDLDLLAELTSVPGLPGRETQVAQLIQAQLTLPGWQVASDALGNVFAHLPGDGEKILLIAHMDEVGLIIRRITEDGFLLVERLGGVSVRSLPGSRLDLWTDGGPLPAHAGVLPGHLDQPQNLELEDIYLDIGAKSRTQAESWGVRIGDGITWDAPLLLHGEYQITGKAL